MTKHRERNRSNMESDLLCRWLSGKESTCQCRRRSLIPGVRKIPCSQKWQPTSVYLPGKIHGQWSQADYSPRGHKESDMSPAAWLDWGLNHSWQAPGLLGSRLPHMTAIRVLPSSFVEQPPLKRSGAEVSSAFSSFNLHQVSSLPESLVQRLELLRITCFLYVWVSLPLLNQEFCNNQPLPTHSQPLAV